MQSEKTDKGELQTWTVEEVKKAFEEGRVVLIDVRTPQEYLIERIPGAMNYPMQEFMAGTLPGEAVKQVVFYCGSGKRSEKVAREVLEAGHDVVAHMDGGFGAWKKAEMPHIATDVSTGAPKRMGDATWPKR
ncbi:MAG: rhodanese-like domain-containing protein [Boseongicola sp.]|nr:rhodanese-like domain-containing protein [Boseongicola sp.]